MRTKIIFGIGLAVYTLYWIGKVEEAKSHAYRYKTMWLITNEEFNMAASMLTTEEKRKVYEFWKENEAFLNIAFPKK